MSLRPWRTPHVIALTVACTALFVASPASATSIDLTASMDCAQANAGSGTCGSGGSGTGTAIILYDTATNLLAWNITWSGLSGTATAMHFHGPAFADQNAGIQLNIGVGTNPAIGSATITDLQETDLLNGLWYINLHTDNFLQGEIRGQVTVVPEPSTLVLLGGGLLLVAGYRRRRSS